MRLCSSMRTANAEPQDTRVPYLLALVAEPWKIGALEAPSNALFLQFPQ